MAKIKLTKNELKVQKEDLKLFKRYLPTLQLKKQQLQMEIKGIEEKAKLKRIEQEQEKQNIQSWIHLYGEEYPFDQWVVLENVDVGKSNIAGVEIPVFNSISFQKSEYLLMQTPLWVDYGVEALKNILSLNIEVDILLEQVSRLEYELKVTSQRVNLFEKVKIPEAQRNIKKINVFLGDEQTAAVVRGKIAKTNLMAKGENA